MSSIHHGQGRPNPRRGRLRGQPVSPDQEEMSRQEKEEQERRDYEHAKHLQEQYDVLAAAASHMSCRSPDITMTGGRDSPPSPVTPHSPGDGGSTPGQDDVDGDVQLAAKLQMELDEEAAAELSAEDQRHAQGHRGLGLRVRGQGHQSSSPMGVRVYRGPQRRDGATGFGMVPMLRRRNPEPPDAELMRSLFGMRSLFPQRMFREIEEEPSSLIHRLIGGQAQPTVDTDDYEGLWDLAEQLGEVRSRGLEEDEVNTLPTSRFKPASHQGASSSTSSHQGADEDVSQCKVCLCDFEAGDVLRTLPCLHKYHAQCIDQWITRNAVCPICRTEIREEIQGVHR